MASAFFTLISLVLSIFVGFSVFTVVAGFPLLGPVGGIIAVIGAYREAQHRHREGYNSATGTAWGEVMASYASYHPLGYTLLTLLLMAVIGAVGAGIGAAFLGSIGQTLGAMLGGIVGYVCVVKTKFYAGDPGHHRGAHGITRPATDKEILQRGVDVNPPDGIWLWAGEGSTHVRKRK